MKEANLAPLDKALYKWFTEWVPKEKQWLGLW